MTKKEAAMTKRGEIASSPRPPPPPPVGGWRMAEQAPRNDKLINFWIPAYAGMTKK